ncbi:MAG TPA: hypothetical protein PLU10_06330, partial [Chitinophagaceae bacterium]|nr:hypothetical protein [Chitinophagaceae bacterium]
LKNLEARGFSPIAYSLEQAAKNELNDASQYDYSIIFITDGGESCQGDICKTYQTMLQQRIKVQPYIIGLDKNDQLKTYYDCLGKYIEVTTSDDIQKAVRLIVDANRPLTNKPSKLNLNTSFSNTPVIKDSNVIKKDTVVKVAVNPKVSTLFPWLTMVRFPFELSMPVNTSAKSIPTKKFKTVVWRFDWAETPKAVVIPKQEMTALFAILYRGKKLPSSWAKAKKQKVPAAKKVQWRFDMEPPALVKETNVMPKLMVIPFKTTANNATWAKAKSRKLKTNKASLRFEYEEPVKRDSREWTALRSIRYTPKTVAVKPSLAKKMKAPKLAKAVWRYDWETVKKDNLAKLAMINYPKRYSYAYVLPDLRRKMPKSGRATLRFTFEAPKPVVKKDSVKKAAPVIDNGELEFTVETENSSKTEVQVFFKGVNGKSYPAAKPRIDVMNPQTNTKVQSFQRTTTGNTPDPQSIDPGTYNFIVTGYSDLIAKNITMVEGKLNKVTIKVTEGSLQFRYIGNRNRPIEFNAVVNRRFAAGATILQKCSEKLYYEPGTYYVEINTIPPTKFSVDLTFGAIYELQIAEPGQLQITNSNNLGKVQLMCELGDQFVVFNNISVNGELNKQYFVMQPGRYKAIIPVNPKMPQMGTKTIDFRITSNKLLDLQLE